MKRATLETALALAVIALLAIVLRQTIDLPATRRHRCLMYTGVTAGLVLAALDPIRRTLRRRPWGLRSPLGAHAYYLTLGLALDVCLWDPAQYFGEERQFSFAVAFIAAGAASVTLFRRLGHHAGALGLVLFWSPEAWLLLANHLAGEGLYGVSVFSEGFIACSFGWR